MWLIQGRYWHRLLEIKETENRKVEQMFISYTPLVQFSGTLLLFDFSFFAGSDNSVFLVYYLWCVGLEQRLLCRRPLAAPDARHASETIEEDAAAQKLRYVDTDPYSF